MLTLNDGRNELWQWDTGRTLNVDADCTQVHFSNKVFGRSIDMNVVDGIAIIPDILLQTDKDLIAWAFVGTPENGYTKISKVFKVNRRNMPADYMFTPQDQSTLGEILDRIEDLENRPSGDVSEEDIQNAVNDYLDKNPISVKETDPTVPAWAKQPKKPSYTAAEVGAQPKGNYVKTVNGIAPDENGDAEIPIPECKVKTVNGVAPDENGNVEIDNSDHENRIKELEMVVGLPCVLASGDATSIASKYVPIATGISLKKGVEYRIKATLTTAVSESLWVALRKEDNTAYVAVNLNTTLGAYTNIKVFTADDDYANVTLTLDAGLDGNVVTASVEKVVPPNQTLSKKDFAISETGQLEILIASGEASSIRYSDVKMATGISLKKGLTYCIKGTAPTGWINLRKEDGTQYKGVKMYDAINGQNSLTFTADADYDNMALTWYTETTNLYATASISQLIASNFDYSGYDLPVVKFTGDTTGMNKDNNVTLSYEYGDRTGTCTLKWQGSSSLAYPKKNYTVVFDNAFEAVEGWGEESKYCLKADWIDFSHCRNIVSAKLWGDVVRTRATSDLVSKLTTLPNCGAIDGFPCFVVVNGVWQGVYNFNIPKDGYMMGMGSGTKEAILCAEGYSKPTLFWDSATLGTEFELEYSSDDFAESDIQASLNRLINACINSDGTDIDTVIAQYVDIDSAIDYLIFAEMICHTDGINKNYLLATYDGVKWFFSAYDMDGVFGLKWNGKEFYSGSHDTQSNSHRLFNLLWVYKRDAIIARYNELVGGVLATTEVYKRFSDYAAKFPLPALHADAELWKTIPSTSINNALSVLIWYGTRVPYLSENYFASN